MAPIKKNIFYVVFKFCNLNALIITEPVQKMA